MFARAKVHAVRLSILPYAHFKRWDSVAAPPNLDVNINIRLKQAPRSFKTNPLLLPVPLSTGSEGYKHERYFTRFLRCVVGFSQSSGSKCSDEFTSCVSTELRAADATNVPRHWERHRQPGQVDQT